MDQVNYAHVTALSSAWAALVSLQARGAALERELQEGGLERGRLLGEVQRLYAVAHGKREIVGQEEGALVEALGGVVPVVPHVRDLLSVEQKLVAETSSLLEAVVKATEGVETARGVHSVAVEMQRLELSLIKCGNDLEALIQSIPIWESPETQGQRAILQPSWHVWRRCNRKLPNLNPKPATSNPQPSILNPKP
jgi:hypothetical protein